MNIVKRDGSIEEFDSKKVVSAIAKAGAATNSFDRKRAEDIAYVVMRTYDTCDEVNVEQMQDTIEKTLMFVGEYDAAKAFVSYRMLRKQARDAKNTYIDVQSTVDEYLSRMDWRVNANANQGYSLGGMILNTSGKVTANYWLSHVYPEEVGNYHRDGAYHIHDLDMLAGYCAGWSLRTLLNEGFNGVPNKVESNPPRHFLTAMSQMVNFLGTLQNEWAGAQAFSSADTYLAPFVRVDNLSYERVKQEIQSFVFNMNVPSRWGCVDTETEVLSVDGFKRYDELKEGDLIYVWDDGRLAINPVRKVVVKPYKGKMHSYKGRHYEQLVTPNHRMLHRRLNSDEYVISPSEEIFGSKSDCMFPITVDGSAYETDEFADRTVIDVASAGYRLRIDEKFLRMTREHADSFVTTWGLTSNAFGKDKTGLLWYADNETADMLQHIALLSGYCSYKDPLSESVGFVVLHTFESSEITDFSECDYDGLVWCPNVEAGTAVFRRNGSVFISGQTQTPFSNLTFDWVCPDDLKNQVPLIGGEPADFTYGELQEEMDMINRAFIEVMTEGDARGRVFTFPIPTYNITKDFPWDSPNADLMFEMTAKYGLPYFQNFVNSELQPNMVRSMCPLRGDQHVIVYDDGEWVDVEIGKLYNPSKVTWMETFLVAYGHSMRKAVLNEFHGLEFIEITCENGKSVVMSTNHENIVKQNIIKQQGDGLDVIFVCNGSNLAVGDMLPFGDALCDENRHDVGIACDYNEATWSRIVEIKYAGSGTGYCFSVIEGDTPMFMMANGLLTRNCRLQLDLRELLKRGNGLFGSAEQTGSIGVVTMNMARLGYKHKGDMQGLIDELDTLMEAAKVSLELKRKEIQRLIDNGLFPYTKRYLGTLRNHFSTIGVNGINEMIRNFTNDEENITTDTGRKMAISVLDHVREKMVEFQEETGHMYNLEATPAEGTTYRFAREDRKRFPDIIQAGTPDEPYYTNSSQLPVGYTNDPFKALDEQEELQCKYTGGTVLHLYLGERVSDAQACKKLVKRALEGYRLPYITVTPTFSICPKHGYIAGEHAYCPICDADIAAKRKSEQMR